MEIHNTQDDVPLPSSYPDQLRALLNHLQETFHLPSLEPLTIVLVNDDRIRELNRQFLGRDRPTNVLAFDLGDTKEIYISVQTAVREFGPDAVLEGVAFYAFHGILHLSGFDHLQAHRQKEMKSVEHEAWRMIQQWFSSSP